jgi:phage terminase large subunit-like protein
MQLCPVCSARGYVVFNRDEETGEARIFVPAKLSDNAFTDEKSYVKSLNRLDPVTRKQLLDGREVPVHIEQEKGSAGKNLVNQYSRKVLLGLHGCHRVSHGRQRSQSHTLANAAERGNVKLVRGTWNTVFLDEVEVFPFGAQKDQVDCAAYDYNALCIRARKPIAR